ncbi:hypothetical protein JW796_00330 [Candidatus Dojkabacteria bacterium]|nr:hypothetical protein [Candidatus Dojkabacteria bacterium]
MKILVLSTRKSSSFSSKQNELLYRKWAVYGQSKGHVIALSGIDYFDEVSFSKAFSWDKNGNKIEETNFAPDVIYLKVVSSKIFENYGKLRLITSKFPAVNSLDFVISLESKVNQSLMFKEYLPETFIVTNSHQIEEILNSNDKDYLLKPDLSTGGQNILFLRKNKYPRDISHAFLVQEMIDNTKGTPGITDGRHDMRFMFVGGELKYALLRKPKGDSFFANAAKGGSTQILDAKKIDKDIMKLPLEVAKIILSKWGKDNIFTVDVIVGKGEKVYLMEVNTFPGISYIDEYMQFTMFDSYFNLFSKIIDSYANKTSK